MAKPGKSRSASKSIAGLRDVIEIRRVVEIEAERILLEDCQWGEPGQNDPDEGLRWLLRFCSGLVDSNEGPISAPGVVPYRGTAELAHEAQEEYERLRRILNRAFDSASTKIYIKNNAYFVAWNQPVWEVAVNKVRTAAVAFCERSALNNEPCVGVAYPVVHSLAQFPYHQPAQKMPSFSELLGILPPYAAQSHKTMVSVGRPGFIEQLKRLPSSCLPSPWQARQWACLSILLKIPSDDELVPTNENTPLTVADVIEIERSRLAER